MLSQTQKGLKNSNPMLQHFPSNMYQQSPDSKEKSSNWDLNSSEQDKKWERALDMKHKEKEKALESELGIKRKTGVNHETRKHGRKYPSDSPGKRGRINTRLTSAAGSNHHPSNERFIDKNERTERPNTSYRNNILNHKFSRKEPHHIPTHQIQTNHPYIVRELSLFFFYLFWKAE